MCLCYQLDNTTTSAYHSSCGFHCGFSVMVAIGEHGFTAVIADSKGNHVGPQSRY
ncbi:MAG: hypothetical protein ACRC5A_03225 [Enterobacteriaceae bacterium]